MQIPCSFGSGHNRGPSPVEWGGILSVHPFIHLLPLARPETPPAGPQIPLASHQTPPAVPQTPPAGPQAPLAGPELH